MIHRLVVSLLLLSGLAASQNRVTILYDAFGKNAAFTPDWGFSAFIEYDGKRILFDTGNNADTLAHNAQAAKVDLSKLDFVVVSHRHTDHSMGISYLQQVNPAVKIYIAEPGANIYGGKLPEQFLRKDASLPAEMEYFGGHPPDSVRAGSVWPRANFVPVLQTTEVMPGFWIIPTVSDKPGTKELKEITLAIKTNKGLLLFDGCSHSGVENILKEAQKIDPHVHLLFGGLHMVTAQQDDIDKLAKALHEDFKLDEIAPGHCTGEPEFAAIKREFGDKYVYAGLGTVVAIP